MNNLSAEWEEPTILEYGVASDYYSGRKYGEPTKHAGFIHSYVVNSSGRTCAIVVEDHKLVEVPIEDLTVRWR
ncbi:MAG: hypothetical protein KGO96_10475 [Elusimicrobia bacterium]|nr:hypothetical protein [Elusimicrobiota bacterium]